MSAICLVFSLSLTTLQLHDTHIHGPYNISHEVRRADRLSSHVDIHHQARTANMGQLPQAAFMLQTDSVIATRMGELRRPAAPRALVISRFALEHVAQRPYPRLARAPDEADELKLLRRRTAKSSLAGLRWGMSRGSTGQWGHIRYVVCSIVCRV